MGTKALAMGVAARGGIGIAKLLVRAMSPVESAGESGTSPGVKKNISRPAKGFSPNGRYSPKGGGAMNNDSSVNVNSGQELPPIQPSTAPASTATPERAGGANDAVGLSADQAYVRQLESTVQALPEVRQDKVEKLQQAIQGGTYDVSNHLIAEAMLTDLAATPEKIGNYIFNSREEKIMANQRSFGAVSHRLRGFFGWLISWRLVRQPNLLLELRAALDNPHSLLNLVFRRPTEEELLSYPAPPPPSYDVSQS